MSTVVASLLVSLVKSHSRLRSALGCEPNEHPVYSSLFLVGVDDVTHATVRNVSPGLGLREGCGIESAVRWVIVGDIGLGYTQWLCCQRERSKPCQMVIAISSGSARVVGHHSAAVVEDCKARTQWRWQMETYAALATIRSCKCGIDVDSLMARRERTHRRNYGPYVSNHFYPARRIRYPCHWSPYRCTQELSSLSSAAFTGQSKRQETFRQQIIQLVSAISNRERVSKKSNALSNDASEAQ